MKQQEEYITPEERAKEIDKDSNKNYKEIMQMYALTILSRIEGTKKVNSILEFFEENYRNFDIVNVVKIVLEGEEEGKEKGQQEGNKPKEDKISIIATSDTNNLHDYLLSSRIVKIKDTYTVETFPLAVLGELFQKITIKKFLLDHIEKEIKKEKANNNNKNNKTNNNNINSSNTKEIQPSQIKRINEIYISNTKLSNSINKIPLSNEEMKAIIYVDKERKIPTTLKITNINYTNEEIKIKGYNKINYFDKFVHDTVCTFWEQGQTEITPTMILRAMRGNPKQKDFSRQQVEAVTKSLNKMRCTLVEIDATQEAKLKKWIDKDSKMIFKSYLLPLTSITILTGGNTLDGFNIITCPPLWAYTQQTNQRITVKDDLIKNLSFDKHGIIYYLIHRLHLIKYKQSDTRKNNSNVIILENMFTDLDLTKEFKDKKQKKKILDNITKNLDVWIKQKDIKHYEVITEGKVKSKIKILI